MVVTHTLALLIQSLIFKYMIIIFFVYDLNKLFNKRKELKNMVSIQTYKYIDSEVILW
jgi:hypothetical protein